MAYLSKAFRWEAGRQSRAAFYYKMLLLTSSRFPVPFDCYLLKYPTGSEVPTHRDPVTDARHFRLNIILRAATGGIFSSESYIYQSKRIKLFRPDLNYHQVSTVTGGTRYVLSIGWALKNK